MNKEKKVLLIILDGWGIGQIPESSAIAQANTPFWDSLNEKYPHSELVTYGESVGLPEGQMGNSEVGHMNIGGGRIVYQDFVKINKAIKSGELQRHPILLKAFDYAKTNHKKVHFLGLLSDGGIHSHNKHLYALMEIADAYGLKEVFVHAFMDGRDTDPRSGIGFVKDLLSHAKPLSAQLATVVGRYYAMDRDKRWDRIKVAYDLLTKGKGEKTTSVTNTIQKRYDEGETDEFLKPIVVNDKGKIEKDDVVVFFNFRADRPREITMTLTQQDMPEFGMATIPLYYVTMTRYEEKFKNIHVLFDKDNIQNSLGEILAKNNKTQLRIAETEKYAHVTFFFSGGREEKFKNEKRILIPSPKVATYDLKPEMSAYEVTDALINAIDEEQPDFIALNYANSDMVGHTGILSAAKKAVEAIDENLQRLVPVALKHNYYVMIIADHGNSDFIVNPDGTPNTAHSMNPVPCVLIGNGVDGIQLKNGKLADVAPTILALMGIEIPREMTGEVLV